jgi:hypothetical protein
MRAGGVQVEVGTVVEETMFGGSASTGMARVDGGAIMALQRTDFLNMMMLEANHDGFPKGNIKLHSYFGFSHK